MCQRVHGRDFRQRFIKQGNWKNLNVQQLEMSDGVFTGRNARGLVLGCRGLYAGRGACSPCTCQVSTQVTGEHLLLFGSTTKGSQRKISEDVPIKILTALVISSESNLE